MKREELYRTKYCSEKEFRTAVDDYIVFYNERRPHRKNLYKTPMQKEQDFMIMILDKRVRIYYFYSFRSTFSIFCLDC